MKIGLVDVDSHNFPNLPLMKISAYHKKRGDDIEFAFPFEHYDKIYISKIFGEEYSEPDFTCWQADEIVYGGIVIENPVGVMSTVWRTPEQIIQPYMFGDAAEKKTCLWLKGVPPLVPTNEFAPPERVKFDSGKSMSKWYADSWYLPKKERSRFRSQTFPGFAKAMASQWGNIKK